MLKALLGAVIPYPRTQSNLLVVVMKKLKVCWVSAGISSFMAGYLAGDVDEWIYIDIGKR